MVDRWSVQATASPERLEHGEWVKVEDYKALEGKLSSALEETETLRMQLAGCGVAAMQNTENSRKERITSDSPYWSASYGDVCSMVDREIEQRNRLDALLSAARFTLTEQRREFERGAISDLDRLEDAISACGVEIPVETCTNAKVGTFPGEPHPDVKRWPLGPVQIYPDVETPQRIPVYDEMDAELQGTAEVLKPCPHCGFTLNRNEPHLLCHKCQKPLDVERRDPIEEGIHAFGALAKKVYEEELFKPQVERQLPCNVCGKLVSVSAGAGSVTCGGCDVRDALNVEKRAPIEPPMGTEPGDLLVYFGNDPPPGFQPVERRVPIAGVEEGPLHCSICKAVTGHEEWCRFRA